MDLLGIVLIFLTILTATHFKKPLAFALALGSIVAGIFYQVPIQSFFEYVIKGAFSWDTIELLLVIYILTFLQQVMLEKGMLKKAQQAMTFLLNNKRLSLATTPTLIGMMPAPGSVLMACSILEEGSDNKLSKEEMAFIASWYRHIPESCLPTYSNVLAALTISGISASTFLLSMIPFIVLCAVIPYLLFLRKLPKESSEVKVSKKDNFILLIKSFWPIILIVSMLMLKLNTLFAIIATTSIFVLTNALDKDFILNKVKSAFNINMLSAMLFVMIFKEVLSGSGIVNKLPVLFEGFPLPLSLTFALIFFIVTLVGNIQTAVTMLLPSALAVIPGVNMLMLMMTTGHLAYQISPTHLCLTLATQYFNVSFSSIVKKTLPIIGIIFILTYLTYLGMNLVF